MKIKSFFAEYGFQAFLVIIPLVIFALLFWLFDVDWSIYITAAIVSLTFLLIYLINRYMYFSKEQDKTERIEELEKKLSQTRSDYRAYQKDLEEYFLLWVHQIKTPITASYLLLENTEEDTTKDQYQEMMRIENYTNMVMNYLKVMTPSTDMNFSRVALDDLIRPLLKKYRVQFIEEHISLKYKTINADVLTDANLLSIVIEQILSNALKYAKDESITITFEDNILSISDTGIGIHSEDLPRIFEKGYSGFNGQYNQKSSGIGLYLVKKITDRLGHAVSVNSEVGQGTQFSMMFDEDEEWY